MSEQRPETPGDRKPKELPDWARLHLWQVQPIRDVLVVFVVIGLLWLGHRISIVTVPVLLAILLAYLFEPVIRWLTNKARLQRQTAVAAIIAGTILLVAFPIGLGLSYGLVQGVGLVSNLTERIGLLNKSLEAQLKVDEVSGRMSELIAEIDGIEQELAGSEPGADARAEDAASPEELRQQLALLNAERESAQKKLAGLRQAAGDALELLQNDAGPAWVQIREYLLNESARAGLAAVLLQVQKRLEANTDRLAASAATAGASVVQTSIRFVSGTFALLFMGFLTAFFFYFISTQWMQCKVFAARFIPDRHREITIDLVLKFDKVVSGFVRGRLTIAFLQSIVFTLGYLLIGVPAAFVLGPMVAILSIVPYLALVGVPVTIVLLWLETHSGLRGSLMWVLLAPTAFYFFAQALDDYLWTPMIQGKETGMSTPMILFASLAGGALFGVFGLLLAIPVAACLKIVVEELAWPRFKAWAEGRAEDFLPIGR